LYFILSIFKFGDERLRDEVLGDEPYSRIFNNEVPVILNWILSQILFLCYLPLR